MKRFLFLINIVGILLIQIFISTQSHSKNLHKNIKVLTPHETAKLIETAGFPRRIVPIVTCLAGYESRFNPRALNKNTNKTKDYGLLQVNSIWLKSCKMTPSDLYNPEKNVKCAYKIYQEQGLSAWSTFNKFKDKCISYQVPSYQNEELAANILVHHSNML